jgi:hypothetical protein
MTVLGTNPESQTMLYGGQILSGLGSSQSSMENQLVETTIGQLQNDDILDEVSCAGLKPNRKAWLYDNSSSNHTGEGVLAVFVEATL